MVSICAICTMIDSLSYQLSSLVSLKSTQIRGISRGNSSAAAAEAEAEISWPSLFGQAHLLLQWPLVTRQQQRHWPKTRFLPRLDQHSDHHSHIHTHTSTVHSRAADYPTFLSLSLSFTAGHSLIAPRGSSLQQLMQKRRLCA